MNKSNKQEKTKELFNKLIDGVTSIIDSGEYNKFLRFSKNFHNYITYWAKGDDFMKLYTIEKTA